MEGQFADDRTFVFPPSCCRGCGGRGDLSSCCAALQQLWGTRSCGKTDRISELEPKTSVRGAQRHHTSSAADTPPCKVGERKHRDVLRYCAALQQLWGTRNCGKRAVRSPCSVVVSGTLEARRGRGAGASMGGNAAYTAPNSRGAAAWASAPSCSAGASISQGSSPTLRKNLLSGARAARRGRGAHTLHRQKGGVDGS